MQKWIGLAVAGVVAFGVSAQAQCCAGKKQSSKTLTTASAKGASCSVDFLSGLNLSEEQREQVASLEKECAKECSTDQQAKFWSGMKEILNQEQLAQCKAQCEEAGWRCPLDRVEKEAMTDDKAEG